MAFPLPKSSPFPLPNPLNLLIFSISILLTLNLILGTSIYSFFFSKFSSIFRVFCRNFSAHCDGNLVDLKGRRWEAWEMGGTNCFRRFWGTRRCLESKSSERFRFRFDFWTNFCLFRVLEMWIVIWVGMDLLMLTLVVSRYFS